MSEYAGLVEVLRKTCWGESANFTDIERRIAAKAIEELEAEIEQAKAERDAAVADIKRLHRCGDGCRLCLWFKKCDKKQEKIGGCGRFKWRGLEKGAEDGEN